MERNYMQQVKVHLNGEWRDIYLDVELRRSYPSFRSVHISDILIKKAYAFDEGQTSLVKVDQSARLKYGLEEDTYEMIWGAFVELELDENLESVLEEALLRSFVHSNMVEAIDSFRVLHESSQDEWIYPRAEAL